MITVNKRIALLFFSFLFIFFLPAAFLAAMDWPTPDGVVTANFGMNDQGRPVLGTVFSTEEQVRSADKGELIFFMGQDDRSSRLPSPLGSWVALDHGDGILGIYSHLEDSGTAPPAQSSRGTVIANSGVSGWSERRGFYFILFDRRERRWVNPSLIIAPLPDDTPPQILLVQLQSPDRRIIPPGQARISQGRYSIIVNAADTLGSSSAIQLAPYQLAASLNGAEVGSLNCETYSARDGVLLVRRNGLVPVSRVYAPYPAFEVGDTWFTRGQTTLEVIVRDVNGNERNFIRRLEVE